eukprot:m.16285 g.16285  ORF g.16285 m.16285 type:complete len:218 (+) comp5036_c0_seq1:34-687(+)
MAAAAVLTRGARGLCRSQGLRSVLRCSTTTALRPGPRVVIEAPRSANAYTHRAEAHTTRAHTSGAGAEPAAPAFQPRDPDWQSKVADSFAKQTFMAHLGAELTHCSPGEVHITTAASPALRQQHGFFHAGVTTSIADSAAGYAAFSLFESGAEVLSTEFKINLLNPALGDRLIARGRVLKPGKTLTVTQADVFGVDDSTGKETHVATMLATMMQLRQ